MVKTVLFFVLVLLGGCGSSLDPDGRYEVQDVRLLANDIEVGESVRAEIFFETKVEIDGTPDGIEVVVRLDPSLTYISGTSRIYDSSTEDSDLRSPDDVVTCPDGSIFLVYNFSDLDLEDRALAGSSDFGLKFEVLGNRSDPVAQVSAAAGEEQEYSCSLFEDEKSDAVDVV